MLPYNKEDLSEKHSITSRAAFPLTQTNKQTASRSDESQQQQDTCMTTIKEIRLTPRLAGKEPEASHCSWI